MNKKLLNVTSLRPSDRSPFISPSLRLAATAKNRAVLRWLRTAELSAWQDADRRNAPASRGDRAWRTGVPDFDSIFAYLRTVPPVNNHVPAPIGPADPASFE